MINISNKITAASIIMILSLSIMQVQANETLKLGDGSYHVKARSQEHPKYVTRFPVADNQVDWNVSYPNYAPINWTAPIVFQSIFDPKDLANIKKWADGPTPESINRKFPNTPFSNRYDIKMYDRNGISYPMNPFGRTGMVGRGVLGKWGSNDAADPIISRINTVTGDFEILLINRLDGGQIAIPGGMVDYGEKISQAATRELGEEAGINFSFGDNAIAIYDGYVDDPRNTDEAWMETAALYDMLSEADSATVNPVAGDDATRAKFMVIDDQLVNALYASHPLWIKKTMQIHTYFEGPSRVAAMSNAAANFSEVQHRNLMGYADNANQRIKSGTEGLEAIINANYGELQSNGSPSKNNYGLKLKNDFKQIDVGGQYVFNNNMALGAVLYYGQLDGKLGLPIEDSTSQAGKSKLTEFGMNLFGTNSYAKNGFIHLTGGLGKLKYETNRDVQFSASSLNFKGKADGYRYHAGIVTGYNIPSPIIDIEPFVGLTYARVTLDNYRETHRLNENVSMSMNRDSFKGRVGSKFSKSFEFANDRTLTSYFKASYAHEFLAQPKYVKRLVTSKKIVKHYNVDIVPARGVTLLELGSNYSFTKSVDVSLSAQTTVKSKYNNLKQVSLKMNLKF